MRFFSILLKLVRRTVSKSVSFNTIVNPNLFAVTRCEVSAGEFEFDYYSPEEKEVTLTLKIRNYTDIPLNEVFLPPLARNYMAVIYDKDIIKIRDIESSGKAQCRRAIALA